MTTELYTYSDGSRGLKFLFEHKIINSISVEEVMTCGPRVGEMPIKISVQGHKEPFLYLANPKTGEVIYDRDNRYQPNDQQPDLASIPDVINMLGTAIYSALDWFKNCTLPRERMHD